MGYKKEFSYISTEHAKDKHFVFKGDIIIANTEQTSKVIQFLLTSIANIKR